MASNAAPSFHYLIAGPCAAESEVQVYETARRLHAQRLAQPISLFRCGVWKPRSDANAYQGAGEPALEWLQRVRHDFGFEICVEVATPSHVEACLRHDIRHVWIGARTSVNPFSVQEIVDAVKGTTMSVMVKNPAIPDLKLWIGNIERFEKAGVSQLCAIHRGFAEQSENVLRNSPMWDIPTGLRIARPDIPLICDPSHIAGNRQYIKQIAQIALDYGCSGLMLEAHCSPAEALSDADQQFTPEELAEVLNALVFKRDESDSAELLRTQRALIRNIDTQISQLIPKRMRVAEEIARIKRENGIPLVQPAQWNSVVERYEQNALPDALYQEFLQKFLNLLHQYSLKMQELNEEE